MSNITLAPVATATPAMVDSTPDALAAAVAAVSVATDTDTAARSALGTAAVARFVFHARRYMVTREGRAILPDNHRKAVAVMVWLDATGSPVAPGAKERTPGETSLGQFISRYTKVATDMDYGIDALTSHADANAAYKAIGEAASAAKANENSAAEALAVIADDEAFQVWLGTQKAELTTAFKHVAHALKGDGSPYVDAFVRLASK